MRLQLSLLEVLGSSSARFEKPLRGIAVTGLISIAGDDLAAEVGKVNICEALACRHTIQPAWIEDGNPPITEPNEPTAREFGEAKIDGLAGQTDEFGEGLLAEMQRYDPPLFAGPSQQAQA